MIELKDDIKLISSPTIPLGCAGISSNHKENGIREGELISISRGPMRRLRVYWVDPAEEQKANTLAGDCWVCLNKDTDVIFDYDINSTPETSIQISSSGSDTKARDYLKSILGNELLRDLDVEIFKIGRATKARIYYKVWAAGVKTGSTIQDAIQNSLKFGLYDELVKTRNKINETLNKIGN